MKTLPQYQRLSHEAQTELGRAIQACEDEEKRNELRTQLFKANIGLAYGRVMRNAQVYTSGLGGEANLDDCLQEALIGLWRATQDWDPDKGRFSTYATPWIWVHVQRSRERLLAADRPFDRVFRQVRTLDEDGLDSNENDLDALEAPKDWDPEELSQDPIAKRFIQQRLKRLSERQRFVILQRANGIPLHDIAKEIAVSHEYVRQLELQAIERLRLPGRPHIGSLANAELPARKMPTEQGMQLLVADEVTEIQRQLEAGASAATLARRYGVHPSTIQTIRNGTHRLVRKAENK